MSELDRIYFDYNAGAPLRDCARDSVLEYMGSFSGFGMNASSLHREGRLCRSYIDDARCVIKNFAFCGSSAGENYDLIFTSGGTESCNMILRGLCYDVVICSSVEHSAVLETARSLNCDLIELPVDGSGVADLNFLESVLADLSSSGRSFLLCLMFANNETGVLQPIGEACNLVHRYGGYIFVDCAQMKHAFDLSCWGEGGADFVSLSSHKLGGCSGSGAVIFRKDIDFCALLTGGGQEGRLRSGTENAMSIVGFAAAISEICDDEYNRIESLRDALETGLCRVSPEIHIFSSDVARLGNTSCFAFSGLESDIALMSFDLAGFSVGSGSACSSGRLSPSHVLSAMGADDGLLSCALRISLGWSNSMSEVHSFIETWSRIVSGEFAVLRGVSAA